MASASITTRVTSRGEKRYVVRYRLGGRAYPVQHGGAFPTMKEARARRDLVAGELAAGRKPALLLEQLAAVPTVVETLATVSERYRASRRDVSAARSKSIGVHLKLIGGTFGDCDPGRIAWDEVDGWISMLSERMKAASIRAYVGTLRQLLDYAEVDPNPARDKRIKLPAADQEEINLPSKQELEALIAAAKPVDRLATRVLVATGMRTGELYALTWADVDVAGSRFRVTRGKTKAARRWVTIPEDTLQLVLDETPPDDRTADRRVVHGNPDSLGHRLTTACKNAGIAHYTPHDFRHLYISVMHARGVSRCGTSPHRSATRERALPGTPTAMSCSTGSTWNDTLVWSRCGHAPWTTRRIPAYRLVLDSLEENLRADDYVVLTASDGAEAMSMLETASPDVVLLDVVLPDTTGYEVCRQVRGGDGINAPWDPDIPIIMLTAKAEHTDRVRGLSRGADDYLTKPFHYPELLARIRRASQARVTGAGVASAALWCVDREHPLARGAPGG